jgi:hypothetical protein
VEVRHFALARNLSKADVSLMTAMGGKHFVLQGFTPTQLEG